MGAGVDTGWAVVFLVLVVGLAGVVAGGGASDCFVDVGAGGGLLVLAGLLDEEDAETSELVAGRGLQRRLSARFFFTTRLWCPRLRAWLGEKSTERALTGWEPKDVARIAREDRAMRLSSLAAMTG